MVKKSSEAAVRSAEDVEKAWRTAEAEIARERKNREKRGETFTAVSKEEFERKLKRVESPIIIWESWTNTAPPGGTIKYTVGVENPDPVDWQNLVVSVSIGNRNAIVDNDQFQTTFDARFPTYAQPAPVGFTLAAGASTSQSFAVAIPGGIERTGYFGNAVLLQMSFHDVGKYLDRGVFFFEVV